VTPGIYQIRLPNGDVATGTRKDLPEDYARVVSVLEEEKICM
jgi:hypothetical protein